jgi:hypothetical protein
VPYRKPLLVAAAAVVGLSALAAAPADAQSRHRSRGRVKVGGYYAPYYAPYYYRPFAVPFSWRYGWSPYSYGAYGGYGPYGYGRPAADTADARLQVTPREAEVYVDGYRAGRVDDFDGAFQRLHVDPGPHEITIVHPGYRTIRERVYLAEGSTFKIKQSMAPLAPGERSEPPPPPEPRRTRRRS